MAIGATAFVALAKESNMTATESITIRKADERGTAEHGWLHSKHTFSFASYYDPRHMGFHALRVINDDIVDPGEGFGTHPHENMEIISYVVEGALEHKDSMGNGSVIRPNDVQSMSAGTGITHSEYNPQKDAPVRFLQIWIEPNEQGVTPGYEQKTYTAEERNNRLRLVVSPDGAEGSVSIHQDARIYATILDPGAEVVKQVDAGRHIWVQVVKGKLTLNGLLLETGDGAAIENPNRITFAGVERAEILVFDLA